MPGLKGRLDKTEVRAGFATFLTMAYILSVNPLILSEAGLPASDVFFATAVAAAAATLVMGLWAGYPFALAPGMGLNAYFTYSVVLGMGVRWQVALGAVFVEGLLFLLLSLGGVRTAVLNAIPLPLKAATTAGIGFFLAIIGLNAAGVVVGGGGTPLSLGELSAADPILALAGTLVIAVLLVRRVPGAILLGMLATAAVAWVTGAHPLPDRWVAVPALPTTTFFAFELGDLFSGTMVTVILAFLFVDFLDTAGTLVGMGKVGGFLNERGELPRADRAFTADAVGTVLGAVLGTSTVTTYIESATGVEEGGRTGWVAVTVAALFVMALFLGPLFIAVPSAATAPALVVVGALMMGAVADVEWARYEVAIPAFLTIAVMPFTWSIANGIAAGVLSWTLLSLLTGRRYQANAVLYVLSALMILYYVLGPGG